MLQAQYRLKETRDFNRLKKYGQRKSSYSFFLNWQANRLPHSRFGFIASKKIGKANKRNRAVRLLREVVRLNFDRIKPGFDIVFVCRAVLAEKKYQEVEPEVIRALGQAGLIK